MEPHVVFLKLNRVQRGAFGVLRFLAQDGERLVAVAREDDVVVLALRDLPRPRTALARPVDGDAVRLSLHRDHARVELDDAATPPVEILPRDRANDRVDVRLAAPSHDAPQRPLDEVQEVVVHPEPHERHDGEVQSVAVGARPYRRAHGHDVILREEPRVAPSREVLPERHPAEFRVSRVRGLSQNFRGFFPEPDDLSYHQEEVGGERVFLLREHRA
mmetsp:Transcript_708/g.2299  ORF Transcript_708/g.2299 Transcript_708/m.2299 type:complete len:217 (+) Transcript_708:2458-3108(+)